MTTVDDLVLPEDDAPEGNNTASELTTEVGEEDDTNAMAEASYPAWEEPDPDHVLEQLIASAYEFYDARGRDRCPAEQRLRKWVARHRWPERETLKLNRRRAREAYWPDYSERLG
jgi:hypothetical protein